MARIQRDTASYFPHDAYAASGGSDTIKILQGRYGNDGYAAWFKILEKLTITDGHYIDCSNPVKWHLFISYLGINEITTVEILNILVEIGNIDADLWKNKIVWCQSLVNNISDVYKNRRREIPSKPVITESYSITTENNQIKSKNDNNNPVTTKQSKVNKNKVNKMIYGQFQNVLLTDDEYSKLKERFNSQLGDMIEKLSEGIASKGYKYKSHYATILSWARRDNKPNSQRIPDRYTLPDEV